MSRDSKGIIQFYLPPTQEVRTNHTCLYSPAAYHHRPLAGTHCVYPRNDGQAELTWVAGYNSKIDFSAPRVEPIHPFQCCKIKWLLRFVSKIFRLTLTMAMCLQLSQYSIAIAYIRCRFYIQQPTHSCAPVFSMAPVGRERTSWFRKCDINQSALHLTRCKQSLHKRKSHVWDIRNAYLNVLRLVVCTRQSCRSI